MKYIYLKYITELYDIFMNSIMTIEHKLNSFNKTLTWKNSKL